MNQCCDTTFLWLLKDWKRKIKRKKLNNKQTNKQTKQNKEKSIKIEKKNRWKVVLNVVKKKNFSNFLWKIDFLWKDICSEAFAKLSLIDVTHKIVKKLTNHWASSWLDTLNTLRIAEH